MGKRVLLVEGEGDRHVMWNLFEIRKVPKQFEVECVLNRPGEGPSGGVEKLLRQVPTWLDQVNLDRLAVVMDANDKGPRTRWRQVRDRLTARGWQGVPKELPETGVCELSMRHETPRSIRFGLWIMPDNQRPGMIEDFVMDLIPEQDDMLPFVDRFLESILAEQRRFTPAHRPKARIHSWLAVSERPGRPMGQAIKAESHLDVNRPSVQPFLDWVHAALVA